MPSLSQLLTRHHRLLVLDASSQEVQVGLLRDHAPSLWQLTEEEAGTAIFTCAQALLRDAALRIGDIGAFVYCEGPGSMLGTRTIAAALRTWQMLRPRPAYAYQSLAVAGRFEWTARAPRSFTVVADARRDTWHCQQVEASGRMSALQRLPASALPVGELVTPEKFRAWAPPPRPVAVCRYDLAKILPAIADVDLFAEVEAPDTFQHESPTYKKWSAQIHSVMTADQK
jgi:tRNA threonylcarbamoyladenosine biosynthesis protein TsaB